MNTRNAERRCYLFIRDFSEDPDVITTCLKVNPTELYRKDEISPRTNKPFKTNAWKFEIPIESAAMELDSVIRKITDQIFPLKKLEGCLKFYAVDICILIKKTKDDEIVPQLSLTPATILLLANSNCGIDIDLYW